MSGLFAPQDQVGRGRFCMNSNSIARQGLDHPEGILAADEDENDDVLLRVTAREWLGTFSCVAYAVLRLAG